MFTIAIRQNVLASCISPSYGTIMVRKYIRALINADENDNHLTRVSDISHVDTIPANFFLGLK